MATDDLEVLDSGPQIPSFLRDPLGALRRRWPWMLLVFTVGALSTTALVTLMKSRYVASATILVTGQQIPEDFVRSTIEEDPLARINAMLGAILSRQALATLVEKHDLYPELRERETLGDVVVLTRDDITIEEARASVVTAVEKPHSSTRSPSRPTVRRWQRQSPTTSPGRSRTSTSRAGPDRPP